MRQFLDFWGAEMALQLWINDCGHYFVDTTLGGIQVG
ncbi:hypothetical protein X737_13265 [Mesorhizobium sp. L48C026A00]|nr:hypothetical protein X737_13265 [Mesorhizobium sp. L48C026A00]